MSRLIAIDHHAAPVASADDGSNRAISAEWSVRRRFASLVVCVVGSWGLLLVPALIWF